MAVAKAEREQQEKWDRSRWSPESVAAIDEWGRALFDFDEGLHNKARERYEPAIRRLVALKRRPLPLQLAQGRAPEVGKTPHDQFVCDAFSRAGLRVEYRLEHDILYLAERFGGARLAKQLILVENLLFPDGVGLTAAHLAAFAESRPLGLGRLAEIANDERRSWPVRTRALLCLHDLNAFGIGQDHDWRDHGRGEYRLESVHVALANQSAG